MAEGIVSVEGIKLPIPTIPQTNEAFAPFDQAVAIGAHGNQTTAVNSMREFLSSYGALYLPQKRLVEIPDISTEQIGILFPEGKMTSNYINRLKYYLTLPTIITNFSGADESKQRTAWETVFTEREKEQNNHFIDEFGQKVTLFELAYMRNQIKGNLFHFVGGTSDKLLVSTMNNFGPSEIDNVLADCNSNAINELLFEEMPEQKGKPAFDRGIKESRYNKLPVAKKIQVIRTVEDRIVRVFHKLGDIAQEKGEKVATQILRIT